MGSVVEIDASTNKITIMDTNGTLNNMDVDEFLEWWSRPSTIDAYTDTNTMTVIIPDTLATAPATNTTQMVAPINAPMPAASNTPSATQAPVTTGTSSVTSTNPASSLSTSAPQTTQTPAPNDTQTPQN
jgi:hypothetical protein